MVSIWERRSSSSEGAKLGQVRKVRFLGGRQTELARYVMEQSGMYVEAGASLDPDGNF